MSEFLDYIVSLAAEGETALVVKQKPTLVGGEQQFHKDGAIKCTWPAYLPTRYTGKGAWYINTGSFIIDRFKDGKPAASASNVEYCLFLVLDDVGTKAKVPPLKPTWRIETSPGNEQWGYVFSEQPPKGEFSAAIKAIAEAGYTDGGALNPVRNVRLPGSVNIKPGKDGFESRLVEFNRGLEYTLADICAALDVTPAEADSPKRTSLHVADNGNDDVLAWLSSQGLVLEQVNSSGWYGVVCPNASEHSDGNPMGRYHPSNRAYCCYHEHCTDWNSEAFLHWVEGQGGPSRSAGLRDDLLADAMKDVYAKLERGDKFSAHTDAQAIIAAVEAKELGRLEKSELFERFAYVQDDDAYFDMLHRREVSRATFNALYRHLDCRSMHVSGNGRPRVQASVFYDEHRQSKGAKTLVGLTYAAGESELVANDGLVYGNRWVNARRAGVVGDVRRWTDHCRALIPDARELNHIWDVMAYKLQHPERKINHALLLGGAPGCGKDTMFAPFFYAVCGPHNRNKSLVDTKSLESQWGYDYEVEIMVVNELRPDAFKDRRALENTLKPIIAAPPDYLTVNRKGLHPYNALNRLLVVAFSNFRDAIALPSDDRRWFVAWAQGTRMAEPDARALWDWYRAGGFDAIAAWLWARDVSAFNPAAAPFLTEAKAIMIEQARSGSETYLIDLIENRLGEFSAGVIGGPFHKLIDRLQGIAPSGSKVSLPVLHHALMEAGWADMGRLYSRDLPQKKRIYCVPDMAGMSKSDLRRMVEETDASGPGLRAVK